MDEYLYKIDLISIGDKFIKPGKQTLEQTEKGDFVVCDGVFKFNKPVKRKLDEIAIGHYSLVNGIGKKLAGVK